MFIIYWQLICILSDAITVGEKNPLWWKFMFISQAFIVELWNSLLFLFVFLFICFDEKVFCDILRFLPLWSASKDYKNKIIKKYWPELKTNQVSLWADILQRTFCIVLCCIPCFCTWVKWIIFLWLFVYSVLTFVV